MTEPTADRRSIDPAVKQHLKQMLEMVCSLAPMLEVDVSEFGEPERKGPPLRLDQITDKAAALMAEANSAPCATKGTTDDWLEELGVIYANFMVHVLGHLEDTTLTDCARQQHVFDLESHVLTVREQKAQIAKQLDSALGMREVDQQLVAALTAKQDQLTAKHNQLTSQRDSLMAQLKKYDDRHSKGGRATAQNRAPVSVERDRLILETFSIAPNKYKSAKKLARDVVGKCELMKPEEIKTEDVTLQQLQAAIVHVDLETLRKHCGRVTKNAGKN